jgi:hypothetical protein
MVPASLGRGGAAATLTLLKRQCMGLGSLRASTHRQTGIGGKLVIVCRSQLGTHGGALQGILGLLGNRDLGSSSRSSTLRNLGGRDVALDSREGAFSVAGRTARRVAAAGRQGVPHVDAELLSVRLVAAGALRGLVAEDVVAAARSTAAIAATATARASAASTTVAPLAAAVAPGSGASLRRVRIIAVDTAAADLDREVGVGRRGSVGRRSPGRRKTSDGLWVDVVAEDDRVGIGLEHARTEVDGVQVATGGGSWPGDDVDVVVSHA